MTLRSGFSTAEIGKGAAGAITGAAAESGLVVAKGTDFAAVVAAIVGGVIGKSRERLVESPQGLEKRMALLTLSPLLNIVSSIRSTDVLVGTTIAALTGVAFELFASWARKVRAGEREREREMTWCSVLAG